MKKKFRAAENTVTAREAGHSVSPQKRDTKKRNAAY